MMGPKEAVQAALKFLGDMVPDARTQEFEEIEISDDGQSHVWVITLSYVSVPTPARTGRCDRRCLVAYLQDDHGRIGRRNVRSMKIRQLA